MDAMSEGEIGGADAGWLGEKRDGLGNVREHEVLRGRRRDVCGFEAGLRVRGRMILGIS